MDYRTLGKTGLRVSELGFGCGAVGGLMTSGDSLTMTRAIARAVEAGITYFDTAQSYGEGASERNLGSVLAQLNPAVIVGSKVQLRGADFDDIAQAIVSSVERSLNHLRLQRLDLFQLHNAIGLTRAPERGWIGVEDLEAVTRAFERLRVQGKIRHWGINGLGDTAAVQRAVQQCGADTVQIPYNLLNPSAGRAVPAGFPFQDYRGLMHEASDRGIGVIAIRVLAGGALSGSADRHPLAMQSVAPIATSAAFDDDVAAAQRFSALVRAGWAESLADAAIRFALSQRSVSTALLGLSSLEQLDDAIASAERGALPAEALATLDAQASAAE